MSALTQWLSKEIRTSTDSITFGIRDGEESFILTARRQRTTADDLLAGINENWFGKMSKTCPRCQGLGVIPD
jgi:hypothetical protein